MTTESLIKERIAAAVDSTRQQRVYNLRQICAGAVNVGKPAWWQGLGSGQRGDAKFSEFSTQMVDMGRYNGIGANTQIQAKKLAFTVVNPRWIDVDPEVNEVRQAFWSRYAKAQRYVEMFRSFTLDLLIGGQATIIGGVRGGDLFLERGDDIDVHWDPAFKDVAQKRYMVVDKRLPWSIAKAYYPNIEKQRRSRQEEETVSVRCYFDAETRAVLYGDSFIQGPEPNPYERIPGVLVELYREPGAKYASGMVEKQIGTESLLQRMMRALREVSLRAGAPILEIIGEIDEGDVDAIMSGDEAVALRLRPSKNQAGVQWRQGGEISASFLQTYQIVRQQQNAEAGVNDFERSSSDTPVEFASQLALLDKMSGTHSRHAAQQLEQGVRGAIDLLMDLGTRWAPPMELAISGQTIEFGPMHPVGLYLGTDGDLIIRPGEMEYKSALQNVQEDMGLIQTLAAAAALPPGIADRMMMKVLRGAEIDDAKDWIAAYAEAQQQSAAAMMPQMMGGNSAGMEGVPQMPMNDLAATPNQGLAL